MSTLALPTTVGGIAYEATGARFRTEQTGGGCTVLAATLEGGATLVLCSNLSAPQMGDEGTTAALFARGEWQGEEQADPIRDAWTDEPLTAAAVRTLIAAVLA